MYQFNMYFQYFLFILYAFWWPQIYCNATRDAPKSTTPLYIIVVSICRLAVPLCMSFTIFDNILDLYGCPHNIVGLETNPVVCILLVMYVFIYWYSLTIDSWVFIQAAILVTQYVLGPRWFVPKFVSKVEQFSSSIHRCCHQSTITSDPFHQKLWKMVPAIVSFACQKLMLKKHW